MRLFFLSWLALIMFLMPAETGASANGLDNCLKCHDFNGKPQADVTGFDLPSLYDGSATGSTVDKTACRVCHTENLADFVHSSSLSVVRVNGVVYGSFADPASIHLAPDRIHYYHKGISTNITGPTCIRCHGTVSCLSCHSRVSHSGHYTGAGINPQTGQPINTPVLSVVNGWFNVANGYSTPYWPASTTCAAAECHGALPKPLRKNTNGADLCFNCHNTGLPGHTNVSVVHQSQYVAGPAYNCGDCHQSDIAAEHALRKDVNGRNYNCFTCHNSAGNDVKLAIAANNTRCDACHISYDHEKAHTLSDLDASCQGCHRNSLVDEHLRNTVTQNPLLGCKDCHQSPDSGKQAAIAAGNSSCAACHATAHQVNLIQRAPAAIPLYQGFTWSIPQPAGIWAGESWMDEGYTESGEVLLSNRRADITPAEVWNYYDGYFTSNGWTPGPGNADLSVLPFRADFSRGTGRVTLWLFKGENPSVKDNSLSGFKLFIIYKRGF
jgi:hypothetical protein